MGFRKEELIEALGPQEEDFDIQTLAAQRHMFSASLHASGSSSPENGRDVAHILKDLPPTSRNILDQMVRFVFLFLTAPAVLLKDFQCFVSTVGWPPLHDDTVADYTSLLPTYPRGTGEEHMY